MQIDDMRLFVLVAQAHSFSAAARRLGLTPAAVSAAIKRIEAAHAIRLMERSTRALRLTAEGERFLAGCEAVLAQWDDTLATLTAPRAALDGDLHIATSADMAYQRLAAWLADFQREHPRLRVTLHTGDRMHDVRREAVDIAVRYGSLPDSALIAVPLCHGPRIPVASPAYLAHAGAPRTPQDLMQHPALLWMTGERAYRDWHLWPAGQADGPGEAVRVDGPLCGDGTLARLWAIEGRGIAFKVIWDVLDDLDAGRLLRVLPDWRGDTVPAQAVLPSRAHQPLRTRAALDLLRGHFAALQQRIDRALADDGLRQ